MTKYFVNRRKGQDRRLDEDRCKDVPVDLFHRKRRKSTDRRSTDRDLSDDYYAYMTPEDAAEQDNEIEASESQDVQGENKTLLS